MATVGELVDRGGLLTLTPAPAERARRADVTALYEMTSTPVTPTPGCIVYVPTAAWAFVVDLEKLPGMLRAKGTVAVIVDTDDARLSAEFVAACVAQSLPIYMLTHSASVSDLRALLAPAQPASAPGRPHELMQPIVDDIIAFAQTTGTTVWLVLDGCVLTNAEAVDFELLAKTLALVPTPLEAISSKSPALQLPLPRTSATLAIVNHSRRPMDSGRIREFVHQLDASVHAVTMQRATRRDLERALIRELIATQVPSAALDPWVASFGLVPGDRVRAVAATIESTEQYADGIVSALQDLGLVAGSSSVAAAHEQTAYALIKTGASELQNPLENRVFDDRLTEMVELLARRGGVRPAVGVSSYVIRSSDDLMRGLINARQLAERQSRSVAQEVPQIALPVPLAATLLGSDARLAEVLQRSLLTPIIDYDAEKGTTLIETLRTFFALDGHWGATANELGIHSNTLRYRLSRVERLTGRGFQSTADRCDYYLALCVSESPGGDEWPTP